MFTFVIFLVNCSVKENEKYIKVKLVKDLIIEESEENLDQSFFSIRSVDVDKSGNIYMLDKRKVLKFTESGKLLWTLDKKGQGPGEFQRTVDLALSNDGKLFVADQNSHKIMIFSEIGEFIDEFKVKEGVPITLDTDSKGYIYIEFLEGITDFLLHKYSRDGKLLNSFLKRGFKDEKNSFIRNFKNDICFCVGHNDRIYVSYEYEYKIMVFNTDGKLLTNWTRKLPFKKKKMKVVQPQSGWYQIDAYNLVQNIAVDKNNNIYTLWGCKPTEKGYVIDVFNQEGELLGNFYSGVKPEENYEMQFFHIDHMNNLFVMKVGSEPKVFRFKMLFN